MKTLQVVTGCPRGKHEGAPFAVTMLRDGEVQHVKISTADRALALWDDDMKDSTRVFPVSWRDHALQRLKSPVLAGLRAWSMQRPACLQLHPTWEAAWRQRLRVLAGGVALPDK